MGPDLVVHQGVDDRPGGRVRVPQDEAAEDRDEGVDGTGCCPVRNLGTIVSSLLGQIQSLHSGYSNQFCFFLDKACNWQ